MAEKSLAVFTFCKWCAYAFAGIFLVYGGVKIILSVLDRDYSSMGELLVFLALGAILYAPAIAFRDEKRWGWYGLIIIYSLSTILVLASLFGADKELKLVGDSGHRISIYAEPDINSPVVVQLPEHLQLQLEEIDDFWYRVQLSGGRAGYVSGASVVVEPSSLLNGVLLICLLIAALPLFLPPVRSRFLIGS